MADDNEIPGRTKSVDGYLIYDWKQDQHRTVKRDPEGRRGSDLGTHEIKVPLDIDVFIPEPQAEGLSARIEVPKVRVEQAIAEDVYDETEAADLLSGDKPSPHEFLATIEPERMQGYLDELDMDEESLEWVRRLYSDELDKWHRSEVLNLLENTMQDLRDAVEVED